MGRNVDVDDLLDASQVAEVLGLSSPSAVSVYHRRYEDFPAPVLAPASGRCQFWHRADVDAWARRRRGSSAS